MQKKIFKYCLFLSPFVFLLAQADSDLGTKHISINNKMEVIYMQELLDNAFFKIDTSGATDVAARWSASSLTPKEKVAILLNDLGTEIRRDGISRWVDKGFANKNKYNHQRIIAAIVLKHRELDPELSSVLIELMCAVDELSNEDPEQIEEGLSAHQWIFILLDGYPQRFWNFINQIVAAYDSESDPLKLNIEWPPRRIGSCKGEISGILYPKINLGIARTDLEFNTSQSESLDEHIRLCSSIQRALWAGGVAVSEIQKFTDGFWANANNQLSLSEYCTHWIDIDSHFNDHKSKISFEWLSKQTEWNLGRLAIRFLKIESLQGIVITAPDMDFVYKQLKEYSVNYTQSNEISFDTNHHVLIINKLVASGESDLDSLLDKAKSNNIIIINQITENERMYLGYKASSHHVSFINLYPDSWGY